MTAAFKRDSHSLDTRLALTNAIVDTTEGAVLLPPCEHRAWSFSSSSIRHCQEVFSGLDKAQEMQVVSHVYLLLAK